MKAYELELRLLVRGKYRPTEESVKCFINTHDRLPACKKFSDALTFKMDISMGFTWILAEVWSETMFSNAEVDKFIADFRAHVTDFLTNTAANLNKEVAMFRNV